MDIFLHLGAHRCASTTFQMFLLDNRKQLSAQGVTSWTPTRTRDGLLRGLVGDPEKWSEQDDNDAIRSIGRFRIEVQKFSKRGQTGLLISDENIIGSVRSNIKETQLYPHLRERLMRIRPVLDGATLKICLTVRSYETFWASCLLAQILRGGAVPHVDLLDFLTTQPRRWRTLVRDIAAVFPEAEIVVCPFENVADHPETQLSALWAKTVDGLKKRDIWHGRSADVMQLNAILEERGEALVSGGNNEAGTRWMPFDEDQSSVLRAEYRRDLAWLKSGADGLATYFEGRSASQKTSEPCRIANEIGSGGSTPAPRPDRAEETCASKEIAALFGGRNDDIEKGLGRSGAS